MLPFSKAMRTLALATVLAILGGCSEYLDRRDTIAKSGGNAVATNIVTHGRSVAARERQPQYRFQRCED